MKKGMCCTFRNSQFAYVPRRTHKAQLFIHKVWASYISEPHRNEKKEEKAMEDLLSFPFCQLNQAGAKMEFKIKNTHTHTRGRFAFCAGISVPAPLSEHQTAPDELEAKAQQTYTPRAHRSFPIMIHEAS